MMRRLTVSLLFWTACDPAPVDLPTDGIAVPAGFPAPRVPADNPWSTEKSELGRYLFYDVRLSGNGTQSCGTCHLQELAFADGQALPSGSTGTVLARNSPSLTNAAYNSTLTWANPVLTELEQQILVPMFGEHPVELGVTGNESEILARLTSDTDYPARFEAAFPDAAQPIDWDPVVDAIASFVRTMISGDSPFDQYAYQNDISAMSPAALRGMQLFYSETLECHHCHGGFNFTEATLHADSVFDAEFFHNTGLYDIDGEGGYPANNTGLFEITGEPGDMGRFRAPTLRNIALTGPYMHDGSIETLEEVIDTYAAGGRVVTEGPHVGDGRANPYKSGLVAGFAISEEERADLVAFLGSLTDESFLTNPALSDPFEED